ncbi:purine permease [Actinomadura barringtoniae]|uniref:Purine permease n=1 Tax=Actinomadura barringtoniae TaxID=1427535 RepID=A0A939P895_9ACTN|nr:nucleobase:cation symporter-2 family protein [Actinomadura barringtoniae]MBO2447495.1 purine permease [Actinomadura barringtoniae]
MRATSGNEESLSATKPVTKHPVDEMPPPRRLVPLAIQHVLVMYASTIAVPLIVAAGLGLPARDVVHLVAADLLLCGIGTLLQSVGVWRIGARLPLVIGAAYNGVVPMVLIGTEYGLPVMYGSIMIAGVFMALCAPLFGRLLRFFPPVVVGTTITLIGITLVPAGARMIFGGKPGDPGFGAPSGIALGGLTLLTVVLLYRFLPPLLAQLSILAAMVIVTVVAVFTGHADFGGVGHGAIAGFPEAFHFGAPSFNLVACLSLVLIQFVLMVETSGQVLAVGEAVQRPASTRDVAAALRADGLVSALGGVFQSFVYITFTQNIGVVTLTRVRSRWVTAGAGAILVLMSVFPVFGRVVASVPKPVLGGATLAMFATVAVIGLRILADVKRDTSNLVIIAVSLAVGLVPMALPGAYGELPESVRMFLDSGVAAGTITAVLLNLLFHHLPVLRWEPADEEAA